MDVGCELEYEDAEAFSLRDKYGHLDRYRESRACEQLLTIVDQLVAGQRDTKTVRDDLGLPPSAIDRAE